MSTTQIHETPENVSEWAVATFGPDGSDLRCAVRANLEMAELVSAVTGGAPVEAIAEECADVCIVLWRLALRMSVPPPPFRLRYDHETHSIAVVLAAQDYMSRLMRALNNTRSTNAEYELRETLHCVFRLSHILRFDLQAAIDAKMAVNRAREWRVDQTGFGFHTKAQS